jgi:hypothetical protein
LTGRRRLSIGLLADAARRRYDEGFEAHRLAFEHDRLDIHCGLHGREPPRRMNRNSGDAI